MGRLRGQRVVHMVHIPKTGGTAVKNALRASPSPSRTRIVLHQHQVRLRDIPASDEVFFFLREPPARFASAFNDRVREGRPFHYKPWTRDDRRTFARFKTPNDLALGLSAPDEETRREARRAFKTMGPLKNHLSEWLGSKELVASRAGSILLIGWTDTLAADFERLKSELHLPASCRLPEGDRRAHRAPKSQSSDLEPEAVANLREWYRDDVELIELCRSLAGATRAAPAVA